ncbi:MAG TPA: S41 family peptidase [Acetobacteraceae bacterium]|nr:S41 family peptidase [Acetobacteraceae bacterium]
MTRLAVLLILLLIVPVHAQPIANPGFDPALVGDVYSVALAFMEPRILEPVPVPVLTVWGLRGLTALDPDLLATRIGDKLVLLAGQRVVAEEATPKGDRPADWAAAAVRLSETAADVSDAVRKAGTQAIIQSFFDELFNHLDPYSRYVPPRETAIERAARIGTAGLGVTLAQRGPSVLVQSVIADGPASMAGLHPGDSILTVDGMAMHGHSAAAVASLLAGPDGTTLHVTWREHGRTRSAELERAMVPPETVFPLRVADVLLIRVTGFDHSTAEHLANALQEGMAVPTPPAGVIIDLRGNRGGLLDEAVEAANELLPAGVVAYTAGRDPDASHEWRSQPGEELARNVPVVLVVDGRTASAAEIMTAALTDRGRAVAVGSTTLGKGLVQTIAPLPDGGELFVTWSRVLAPRGWPLQGLGVLPQVCTSLGEAALRQQLTALAEGQQLMQGAIDAERNARAPLTPSRMLAIRSACPAAVGTDADLATARALIENPAAYAAALLPPMRSAAGG